MKVLPGSFQVLILKCKSRDESNKELLNKKEPKLKDLENS